MPDEAEFVDSWWLHSSLSNKPDLFLLSGAVFYGGMRSPIKSAMTVVIRSAMTVGNDCYLHKTTPIKAKIYNFVSY